MYESVFNPPNSQYLSDCIVGDVATRILRSSVMATKVNFTPEHSSLGLGRPAKNRASENDNSAFFTKGMDPLKRLREQRRRAQVRYRKKKMVHEAQLREDIWHLRQMINQLEVQRWEAFGPAGKSQFQNYHMDLTSLSWKQYNADLSRPGISEPTCWSVAVEYFRLFRYGYNASTPSSKSSGVVDSNMQVDFLRAVMAPDVVYDTVTGVRALVQNWQRAAATQSKMDIHLVRLEKGHEDSVVVAIINGWSTISEDGVRYAFLHLLDGEELSPLARRFVDQRLEMDGVLQMTWDDNQERVVNVQFQANMMAAMLRVLGSLEDVATVFDNASIDPECRALTR